MLPRKETLNKQGEILNFEEESDWMALLFLLKSIVCLSDFGGLENSG